VLSPIFRNNLSTTAAKLLIVSYHGHNACDAVSSHAKLRIKNTQLLTRIPIKNRVDILDCVATLPSSVCEAAISLPGKPPKVPTFAGISSYHMFKFPKEGTIHCWKTSSPADNNPAAPHKVFTFPIASVPPPQNPTPNPLNKRHTKC
jgi:hypothetical protein